MLPATSARAAHYLRLVAQPTRALSARAAAPLADAALDAPADKDYAASTPAIYLDGLATTPLDPRVLDAMLPWMTGRHGNPHSRTHVHGRFAAEACGKEGMGGVAVSDRD